MKRIDLRYALANLFTESNRGLLLDLVVFVANLFLMRTLTGLFIDLFSQVSAEEPLAKFALSVTLVGMWILPVAGAVLKRHHFHLRTKEAARIFDSEEYGHAGCLFNPIFYFCLNLVLMSAIVTGIGDFLFGKALLENGAIFLPLIFGGLILTIVQTVLIYLYFSPPSKPPRWEFLLRPESEWVGDICIFVNMLLFQIAWNILTMFSLGPPTSVLDFLGRLFFLSFVALLIYFPPRLLYLAEDMNRRSTWLTMLLANSPVIARVVLGL
ncbi:MAG TPA: hypothetical protein VFS76_19640 [Pyrinomonadaceae bacterium]|nr:hypothetical protein [Pyrinomonadaceae bacterium]